MSVDLSRLSPTEKRALLVELWQKKADRRGDGPVAQRKSGLLTAGRPVAAPPPLPPARIPLRCVHEGAVVLGCTTTDDRYKRRHCECPDADWDFCARQATPVESGQNCNACPKYQPAELSP